jgi:hypothetical protein
MAMNQMQVSEYRTPGEVVKLHPELPWNAQQIGTLLQLRLVRGRKFSRGCLVYVPDVIAIHRHVKIEDPVTAD